MEPSDWNLTVGKLAAYSSAAIDATSAAAQVKAVSKRALPKRNCRPNQNDPESG